MASEIKVTNIKANDGTASLTIANSNGNLTNAGTLTSTGAITASGGIANAGTITAGTLGSSVTFPAGHEVFIKLQNRSGVGSIGSPTTYYPVTVSALSTESFHITLTNSEHTAYSKIKIQWHAGFRINKDTYAMMDIRLVRWLGTGDVASETVLLLGTLGSVQSDVEEYQEHSGTYVDDISSIGTDQINYTLQMRTHSGNGAYAGNLYFGIDTNAKMQMSATGII